MRKISESVYQITLGPVNAFVIDDNGLTLIDTGYAGSTDRIFKSISKAGKNPEDIKRIILTHLHPDHAGSAAEIKRRLNIPLLAHELDADLIENGTGGRNPKVLSPGLLNWLVFHIFIKRAPMKTEPAQVDQRLTDNDVLDIAGGLQVVHTPGHSKGHIALLLQEEGLLIAGDICANFIGLELSTIYEDMAVAKASLSKVADLDFDKAVFGHGIMIRSHASKKFKKAFKR
ncbi:MAG: MBL fold metallo-hydrolase [Bacteroidetes bacterium]|nr:MAG: MBL fold metallo-hydrolase [Bacteroidota bacterium]